MKADIGCTEINISDEKLMQINPDGKPLTPEILRTLTGDLDMPDEKAEEIIFSLTTFCSILLDAVNQNDKLSKIKSIESNINQPASAETSASNLKQAA